MEAKDTYMSKELKHLNKLKNMGDLNKDVCDLLDRQAEITWKAREPEITAFCNSGAVEEDEIQEAVKAERERIKELLIEQRKHYQSILSHQLEIKPEDAKGIESLRGKLNMLQVILGIIGRP